MSSTPDAGRQPAAISGSWEDLLQQAKTLAANGDEAALPAFENLIDRLYRLPLERRIAGNRRLQTVLDQAILGLHVQLTIHGRYDEAIAVIPRTAEVLSDKAQRDLWARRETDLLMQKGDVDAAMAHVQALAAAPDAELGDWGNVALAFARAGRADEAAAALTALDNRCAELSADGRTSQQRTGDKALVAWVHALVEFESGNVEEALVHVDEALAQDDRFRHQIQFVYSKLVQLGQDELALRYIQRDQAHPVRAGFWHGLALRHLGRQREAEQKWRAVTGVDPATSHDKSAFEYIMSYYALGDPEGDGLKLARYLLGQRQDTGWAMLFLAGLGSALHGEMKAARGNMQVARSLARAAGKGHQLPAETWYLCQEFLNPEQRQRLAEFFESRAATPPAADKPTDEPVT